MNTTLSPGERLLWYIDAVLMERRKFCAWCSAQKQGLDQLEAMHREGLRHHDGQPTIDRVYQRHEAVLRQHGEADRRDEDICTYCLSLRNRLSDFELVSDDIVDEIDHLTSVYNQLRHDHRRMVKERRQLVQEHRAVVESLSIKR